MKRPKPVGRVWVRVKHHYRSRHGHGLVWRCELECGHEAWRPLRHQPDAPTKLVCLKCTRDAVDALRPAWHRAFTDQGVPTPVGQMGHTA